MSSRFSFPCILLKCVELKYSFASKRLKLAAKKYIKKRSARSRVRMKRARKSARGRANPQQIHPRLTRTHASEKNKMALITIISLIATARLHKQRLLLSEADLSNNIFKERATILF